MFHKKARFITAIYYVTFVCLNLHILSNMENVNACQSQSRSTGSQSSTRIITIRDDFKIKASFTKTKVTITQDTSNNQKLIVEVNKPDSKALKNNDLAVFWEAANLIDSKVKTTTTIRNRASGTVCINGTMYCWERHKNPDGSVIIYLRPCGSCFKGEQSTIRDIIIR